MVFSGQTLSIWDIDTKTEKLSFEDIIQPVLLWSFTEKGARELLLADGRVIRIESGKVNNIKTLTQLQLNYTQVIDVDGDEIDDIVTAASWYYLKVISPLRDEIIWSHLAGLDINALILKDINEDGKVDILYGDGQWGSIHALSLASADEF